MRFSHSGTERDRLVRNCEISYLPIKPRGDAKTPSESPKKR